MSEFTQQEMDAITDIALASRISWESAADAYRKVRDAYPRSNVTPSQIQARILNQSPKRSYESKLLDNWKK